MATSDDSDRAFLNTLHHKTWRADIHSDVLGHNAGYQLAVYPLIFRLHIEELTFEMSGMYAHAASTGVCVIRGKDGGPGPSTPWTDRTRPLDQPSGPRTGSGRRQRRLRLFTPSATQNISCLIVRQSKFATA